MQGTNTCVSQCQHITASASLHLISDAPFLWLRTRLGFSIVASMGLSKLGKMGLLPLVAPDQVYDFLVVSGSFVNLFVCLIVCFWQLLTMSLIFFFSSSGRCWPYSKNFVYFVCLFVSDSSMPDACWVYVPLCVSLYCFWYVFLSWNKYKFKPLCLPSPICVYQAPTWSWGHPPSWSPTPLPWWSLASSHCLLRL